MIHERKTYCQMQILLHNRGRKKIHKFLCRLLGMGHNFQRVLSPLTQCNTVFTANLSELLSALLKRCCEITKDTAMSCKIRWPIFNPKAESMVLMLTAHLLLWFIHVACRSGQDISWGQRNFLQSLSAPRDSLSHMTIILHVLIAFLFGK